LENIGVSTTLHAELIAAKHARLLMVGVGQIFGLKVTLSRILTTLFYGPLTP